MVTGNEWIDLYIETLSVQEKKLISSAPASGKFRFGNGPIIRSNRVLNIPVHIGSTCALLTVHVVPYNVPLLISNKSLSNAQAKLDFENHTINIFNESVALIVISSGHYCIDLSRSMEQLSLKECRTFFYFTTLQPRRIMPTEDQKAAQAVRSSWCQTTQRSYTKD